jgi:hypothetical protein
MLARCLSVTFSAMLAWTFCTRVDGADGTLLAPDEIVQLSDNGAWSWFMDPRAIVDHGRLIVGSDRANGRFADSNLPGWGNVELSILDLTTRYVRRVILAEHFEQDDHDAPGLLVLPNGKYLAAYSRHNVERKMFFRISARAGDPFEWGPETVFVTPGADATPFHGNNVTYANPICLSAESNRIYLLHRSVHEDPNYLISDDNAETWRYGGHLLIGRGGYAPYMKYASDGRDTIHFVATEDHPRNFDTSLYHGFIRGGKIHFSDGRVAADLSTTTNAPLNTWDLTRFFHGDPNNRAWMTDVRLDESERPVVLFTVHKNGAGQPKGQGGLDHRFHFAHWDGAAWHEAEIAYAGRRLYAGEDDYTGLGSIDPQDVFLAIISTDADPVSGEPLVSQTDHLRHRELFIGKTRDQGATWSWKALTRDSAEDQLRPVILKCPGDKLIFVWMRGTYMNNHGQWTTQVEAALLDRARIAHFWQP